jgi:hypothetical protein
MAENPPAIAQLEGNAGPRTAPVALHKQSRGIWQRWDLTSPGSPFPLELSIIPISTRNRHDLSITAITRNDPGLKELALKQTRERSIPGTPTLNFAIGALSGQADTDTPQSAVQTCVVMPSRAHVYGATGVNYRQLIKSIESRNNDLSIPGLPGKLAGFAGLGPRGRWSCLFVSLSAAGRGKAVEQQLIHTLQPLIGDLTSRAR